MGCNDCEMSLQFSQAVAVEVQKSGSKALLYIKNQGKNIVLLRRILLCAASPGSFTMLLLRSAPDPISWLPSSPYLELSSPVLFYVWNDIPPGTIVQAQADYIEITGRSRSCPANF